MNLDESLFIDCLLNTDHYSCPDTALHTLCVCLSVRTGHLPIFVQSSKIGTVTTGFDARLAN